jgi:hypothetical protein
VGCSHLALLREQHGVALVLVREPTCRHLRHAELWGLSLWVALTSLFSVSSTEWPSYWYANPPAATCATRNWRVARITRLGVTCREEDKGRLSVRPIQLVRCPRSGTLSWVCACTPAQPRPAEVAVYVFAFPFCQLGALHPVSLAHLRRLGAREAQLAGVVAAPAVEVARVGHGEGAAGACRHERHHGGALFRHAVHLPPRSIASQHYT